MSTAIFLNFCCFEYIKNYWYFLYSLRACSDLYEHPDYTVYTSVPYAHVQHAHQFSHFSNVHLTHSMLVRNWCVQWAIWACTSGTAEKVEQWAYASGTDASAELMSQELVRALSIRVSYLCLHRSQSFKACWFLLSIRIRNWCTLSIRVRNWCVCWAYKAGTDVYPKHKHKCLTHMLIISAKIPNLKRSLQNMLIMLMLKLSIRIRNWCAHWN